VRRRTTTMRTGSKRPSLAVGGREERWKEGGLLVVYRFIEVEVAQQALVGGERERRKGRREGGREGESVRH